MSTPRSVLYVVVAATTLDEERAACAVIQKHLDEIGGPLRELTNIGVYPTNKGIVEVAFEGTAWRAVYGSATATSHYLNGQGYQLVRELPNSRLTAPPHKAETGRSAATREVPTLLAPVDALLTESVLAAIADHGLAQPDEIAAELNRPVEIVEALLRNLASAGLVTGNVEAVFRLTEAGAAEFSSSGVQGGRKALVAALQDHEALSVYDMCELLGCTPTVPKRALRLLMNEGMVEPADKEPAVGRARPRQRYRLTAYGQSTAPTYTPGIGRRKTDWNDPTPQRVAIMKVLLDAIQPMSPREVATAVGGSLTAVGAFLRESLALGYVQREEAPNVPQVTYLYSLTDRGRTAALVHVSAEAKPTESATTRAWVVLVSGDHPGIRELLEGLTAVPGVLVAEADAS